MIEIILASAGVSLLTIGILFIQRIRPKKLRIPSYFLGEVGERKLLQLKSLPPRWWEWVLVILATLGAGLAYYAHSISNESSGNRGEGLIWLDPTMSHIVALNRSKDAQDTTLEALENLRLGEYIFIELGFEKDQSNKVNPIYQFKRIPAAALREYFVSSLKRPSVLSQPLDPESLKQSIKKESMVDPTRVTLTLVTDAQAETLRPLSALSTYFEAINIVRTPRSNSPLIGQRTALIPEDLLQIWTPRGSTETNEPYLPGTPNFIRVEGSLASIVPPQARPTLSVEEFNSDEKNEDAKNQFSLFIGEDTSTEVVTSSRKPQPLLTTCTLDIAGPTELDGMADLRAYAQFFKIPVRPMQCRSTESSTSARALESLDPWKYRRASIWVVPLNEYVGGVVLQQGVHWIPEGFAPETDGLVYIADTRLQGTDSFLENVTLQLEENQPTIRMPLLPLPTANYIFPWELKSGSVRPKTKPISTEFDSAIAAKETPNLKTLLTAADGTPLAFQLAATPPTIYLRTGGAAPNGELGRWGQWASLWNNLRISLGQNSPLLSRIQMRSAVEWAEWLNSKSNTNEPPLRYQIELGSLKGVLLENKREPLMPSPALYVRERDDQLVLIEPHPLERQNEALSTAELEQLFPRRGSGIKELNNQRPSAAPMQIFGSILALASVVLLWLLQGKRLKILSNISSEKIVTLFISGILVFSSVNAEAQGQKSAPFDMRTLRGMDNRPEVPTYPFRIAWCDATIPAPVKQRYAQLQALLASRGTIDLPKELTPGACRVGAAELWWTSSLEALQAAQVSQHIRSGGVIIAEGITLRETPQWMLTSADPSIGLNWESPKRRGLLYRSFYLLSSFDGCTPERTLVLTLRKKVNALAPMAIVTPARFLTHTSEGADCFIADDDYRSRSFVNMMYALLTTDYKEDQMQLPEILNRVRNLGLEP